MACGKENFILDQACLNVITDYPVELSFQISECQECDLMKLKDVNSTENLILSTVYNTLLNVTSSNYSCWYSYKFRQHGIYSLNITSDLNDTCPKILIDLPPDDAYKPLWLSLFAIMLFIFISSIGTCCSRQIRSLMRSSSSFRELQNDLGRVSEDSNRLVDSEFVPNVPCTYTRVKSVDAMRGLTIALMIFVNSGGGKYWIFEHSSWNGLTIADLVFPWFAWIMGFSIVLFVKSQLRMNRSRSQIYVKILTRSCVLVLLGLVVNSASSNDISRLRLPGVLQRLGLSYLIVASVESFIIKAERMTSYCIRDKIKNSVWCWLQWGVILGLVAIHHFITFYMEVDGCPTGYVGPGGLHDHGKYWNCTGGAAGYIDRLVFGLDHVHPRPTSVSVYQTTMPFDPEGLLGVLTTCFTVFLGAQVGHIIQNFTGYRQRYIRLFVCSAVLGIIGGYLTNFSQNGGSIPINKNLWSLSYVLITASLAFLTMMVLFILIDYLMVWDGTPFAAAGRNPLLLYLGSVLCQNLIPWTWQPVFDRGYGHTGYLLMNYWTTFLWLLIAHVLDKNRIYFSV